MQLPYLDYQATTPLDPAVLDAMMPYLTSAYGNPHSTTHRYGWEADAGIAVARDAIAALAGVAPKGVVFTSGATEANNLALTGTILGANPKRRRLVTVATEHACILETAAWLQSIGAPVTIIGVQQDGLIDPETLQSAMAEDVALVSVMAVNNEIGVLQPLAQLAEIARAHGALIHTDAAQAFGKIDMAQMPWDLMSVSAHKMYGPKGIGAMVARDAKLWPRMTPHMHGGGQEQGVRSGTLSPALCAGFGAAAQRVDFTNEAEHVLALWRRCVQGLQQSGLAFQVNGSAESRWFGNLNVSFAGVDGARLLGDLRSIAVSSGAACASAAGKASYVLEAIGVPARTAQATLRIGFGRPTTADEVDYAVAAITAAVQAQQTKVA
jgi:cysteine desulfurase